MRQHGPGGLPMVCRVVRSSVKLGELSLSQRLAVVRAVCRRRDSVFVRLAASQRRLLVKRLILAAGWAAAGIPEHVLVNRKKRQAWAADMLVFDVCRAFEAVNLPVTTAPQARLSHVQMMAGDLIRIVGLPEQGELFHQMRRARRLRRNDPWTDMR